MANSTAPGAVRGLSEIADGYTSLLCDVWGVVHNGVESFAAASDALVRFRQGGGRVLLITNAPRPTGPVLDQLDGLGVPRTAYDGVLTSGDVTRDCLVANLARPVFHVGPERDRSLYDGLPLTFAETEDEAGLISCTGLVDDETETVDDYVARLLRWTARGLPMICANPDLVVERGDKLIPCAGALAEAYRGFGGTTIIVGKPYPPIYEAALRRFGSMAGRSVGRAEILAIGDGAATDVSGAFREGIDTLFVTAGIHARAFVDAERPSGIEIAGVLAAYGIGASSHIARLAW